MLPAAEVVGFAVPQFVTGRAHRALQRVAAHPQLALQLRLREGHLLQPLAGLMVALWQAEQQEQEREQPQEQAPRRRQSLLRALGGQAALSDDALRGVLRAEVSPGPTSLGACPPCSPARAWCSGALCNRCWQPPHTANRLRPVLPACS